MAKPTLENFKDWPFRISQEQLHELGISDGLIHVWRSRLIAVCCTPTALPKFRTYYSAPIIEHLQKKQSKKVVA